MAANPVEPDLALHQSLPNLLRNLLQNPVELDLALHQSLADFLRNLWNLLRISFRCWGTKKSFGGIPNSRNVLFLQIFLNHLRSQALETPQPAPKPPKLSPEPSPKPYRTWLASAQSLPEPSPEPPAPEPCWTWPASAPNLPDLLWNVLRNGSAPKPPRPSPEPNLLRNPLNLTWLQSFPDLLQNRLRDPVEHDLALHQSLPDLRRNLLRHRVEPDLAQT